MNTTSRHIKITWNLITSIHEYSLEGLMLKLQYFGHQFFAELTHWKRPWCYENWKQQEKGMTEGEMVGWHHWLNGHEFEQAPGVGDGQGSLARCSPRGHKESDTTEWLSWDWAHVNDFWGHPAHSFVNYSHHFHKLMHNPENIYNLTLYKKSLLTPVTKHSVL